MTLPTVLLLIWQLFRQLRLLQYQFGRMLVHIYPILEYYILIFVLFIRFIMALLPQDSMLRWQFCICFRILAAVLHFCACAFHKMPSPRFLRKRWEYQRLFRLDLELFCFVSTFPAFPVVWSRISAFASQAKLEEMAVRTLFLMSWKVFLKSMPLTMTNWTTQR